MVSAVGLFTQPVLPDLVEEEPFTGTIDAHRALGPLRRPAGRAGGRPRHGSTAAQLVPEVAKVAKKVYSVQRSPDVDPAEAGPALHRAGEVALRPCSVRQEDLPDRLWLRSESNISVIENGSDKTQEFKGIALRALEATVRR